MLLITTLFTTDNKDRIRDYTECIKRNLENEHFNVLIFYTDPEGVVDYDSYPFLADAVKYGRLQLIVKRSQRISFSDVIDWTNRNCPDSTVILSNTDIYFDDTIQYCDPKPNEFWGISRYDNHGEDWWLINDGVTGSSDTWVFKGNIPNIDNVGIYLGIMGCDSFIMKKAYDHNLTIKNPSYSIKCYHIDDTSTDRYAEGNYRQSSMIDGVDTYLTHPDFSRELRYRPGPSKCFTGDPHEDLTIPLQLPKTVRQKRIDDFKCYTWPNPAFPFRLYLDHPKCRIFILENLSHNTKWLIEYANDIKPTDFFFIVQGCVYDHVFKTDEDLIKLLNLNKENFFYLCNSQHDVIHARKRGFRCALINSNCWLDEQKYICVDRDKLYNAIYNAPTDLRRRQYLANKIVDLALITNEQTDLHYDIKLPPHIYKNNGPLDSYELSKELTRSHCGLFLAEHANNHYEISEYLLCGIPVVYTYSNACHVWCDEYNSVVCDANEDSVADAVSEVRSRVFQPFSIRSNHIKDMRTHRNRFILQLQNVFDRFKVTDFYAERYFYDHYFHKMRRSNRPNLNLIFRGIEK